MAIIKYAAGETPRRNKQKGFTFQRNNYGESMFPEARNDRTRNISQHAAMTNLQKAVRFWREMSAATKQNWNDFAAAYPQASRRNPATFLTGYQLFIKRNHYQFLFCGLRENFLESPTMELLADPGISFAISSSASEINVTELYLSHFGFLPAVGDHVLLRAYPMATNSGQFFTPVKQIIEVDEIFIDGMFISLVFASPGPGVSVSLYLSKIINQSISYVGTKVKYMGCFSSKTFLNLTDTPDDYTGQAEKQVAVKADESGLEFVEGGGGGLTCETMQLCPSWISLVEQVNANTAAIIGLTNESMPIVYYGLIYAPAIVHSAVSISSGGGWIVPTYSIWAALRGRSGYPYNGGYCKEAGLVYWNSPNTLADNSLEFNARGAGNINDGGLVGSFKNAGQFLAADDTNPLKYWIFYMSNGNYRIDRASYTAPSFYNSGRSLRLCNPTTTLADGEKGVYFDNSGHAYRTIVIDGVEWMADNLRDTKLSDKSDIPFASNTAEWALAPGNQYAYPNYDSANV